MKGGGRSEVGIGLAGWWVELFVASQRRLVLSCGLWVCGSIGVRVWVTDSVDNICFLTVEAGKWVPG